MIVCRRMGLLILLMVLVGIGCGISAGNPQGQVSGKTSVESIVHGGMNRSFRVYAPISYGAQPKVPLLMALHGGGGTGKGMQEQLTQGGFDRLADKEGFIVVYPDGIEKHWNDGRGLQAYRAHAEDLDDVGFLSALVDHLARIYPVDRARVYATGISNGGMMSFRLACERPEEVAGIAVITAALSDKLALGCRPSEPVPVLIMNGTKDPLVPWDGGDIRFMNRTFGTVLSTPDTAAFWKRAFGCGASPASVQEWDKVPEDGTSVRSEVFSGCEGGVEVALWTIQGAGHTWPGGYQYLPESFIGKTSKELDANQVVWDFLKRWKKTRPSRFH